MERVAAPDYDTELDGLFEREFWEKFHATPDYPSTKRLRFIKDPQMRRDLLELHEHLSRGPSTREPERDRDRRQDHERRLRMTIAKALEGQLGESDDERQQAREIAERMMPLDRRSGERQRDPAILRQLIADLKSLRVHYSDRNVEIDGGFQDALPLSPPAQHGIESRY